MDREMTEAEVMGLLERTGALKRGHFVLSSGLHSDRYCQCAALFERPADGERVARAMASRLAGRVDASTVVAPALGGVLWGYELARATGARSIFAERVAGTFRLRRGFALRAGERVILAEDVTTTGGSVLELAEVVEGLGAEVAAIASVVDRSEGRLEAKVGGRYPVVALLRLRLATYPPDALPPELASIPVEDPGSRRASR